jgi:hypothetical protein
MFPAGSPSGRIEGEQYAAPPVVNAHVRNACAVMVDHTEADVGRTGSEHEVTVQNHNKPQAERATEGTTILHYSGHASRERQVKRKRLCRIGGVWQTVGDEWGRVVRVVPSRAELGRQERLNGAK